MALTGPLTKPNDTIRSDLAAYWTIPLLDGLHTIEFEHGTTSGKRVLRVDGEEIVRREWMFKLVGEERFHVGQQKALCELRVDPENHFMFAYSLWVDGKPYDKFLERQNKILKSWAFLVNQKRYRIVIDKQSLNVFINGREIESHSDFVTNGTEIILNLELEGFEGIIKATTASKSEGVIYKLYINREEISEDS